MTEGWSIGAFDPSAWAGLVLTDGVGHGFALRFAVERDGERADGPGLFYLAREVGPHSPDGSYARVSFDAGAPFGLEGRTPRRPLRHGEGDDLVLEWSVTDGRVVARVGVGHDGFLDVIGYFPWDWEGECSSDGASQILARCAGGTTVMAIVSGADVAPVPTRGGPVDAGIRLRVRNGSTVYLAVVVGPGPVIAVDPDDIDATIDGAAEAYRRERVSVEGEWADLAASITNNIHWMVSLQPETGRLYTPAGRRWIFPAPGGGDQHWTIFCWDAFLNALELAVESPALANSTIRAVLATQYDNGNIPNWRGRFNGTPDRSQPPIGSFAVLKCFLRTGDRSLLEIALPFLERWSQWWRTPRGDNRRRDGNGNGLFNWGCDVGLLDPAPPPWERDATHHQRAAWESGQDDLPNWDDAKWVNEAGTIDLDSVDLNSLLALDYECLAQICEQLGLDEKGSGYRELRRDLVESINTVLWNDETGLYLDRHWDGRFSQRLAASHFLPLLAGIPDQSRATRMLATLTDETKFWGEFVIPTISRDDPAFPEQQYWRGTIWPPTNYLVYQGLRRYHFDRVASELARRSVKLFLGTWRGMGLCRENYDSRSGQGGGQWFQSWGPLFALCGIEEFVDVTPWEGLRFGGADDAASSLRNIRVVGSAWEIRRDKGGLEVLRNGTPMIRADAPVVVRNVVTTATAFTASVSVERQTAVRVADHDPVVFAPGEHSIEAAFT